MYSNLRKKISPFRGEDGFILGNIQSNRPLYRACQETFGWRRQLETARDLYGMIIHWGQRVMVANGLHPSLTRIRDSYLDAIRLVGFRRAHLILLQDLKYWFSHNPEYQGSPMLAAQRALDLHASFLYLGMHISTDLPSVQELDSMFIFVFGEEGELVVHNAFRREPVKAITLV